MAGEKLLAADTEIAIRETRYEAKALDDVIGQVRQMLSRTTARANENVIRALLALGALTEHSERYVTNKPTRAGGLPSCVRSPAPGFSMKTCSVAVTSLPASMATNPEAEPELPSPPGLDQLVGERKILDRRRDLLTRGPAPALLGPPRLCVSSSSPVR